VLVRLDHLGVVVGWTGKGDRVLRAEGFGAGDCLEGYFVATRQYGIAGKGIWRYGGRLSGRARRTMRFHVADLICQYGVNSTGDISWKARKWEDSPSLGSTSITSLLVIVRCSDHGIDVTRIESRNWRRAG
jgi:hypothetical protein